MSDEPGRYSVERMKRTLRAGTPNPLERVDDLLRHGGVMAVAIVAAGALNYAYQVFVGRALGPAQYGTFGALTSFLYLLNVVGRGVRMSTARFVSARREDGAWIATFYRGIALRTLLFATAVFALLTAFSPQIAGFVGAESAWPVVLVAVAVPFTFTLPTNFGFFQGVEAFRAYGAYNALQAGLTLLIAVVLLVAGFGLYGALGALAAASAIALGVSTWAVHRYRGVVTDPPTIDYTRAYRYALPAVLAGFCLTVPTSVDVVLAKHFFAAEAAGRYTAVAVLGKVLIFLPLGISMALFPKVSAPDAGDGTALFARAFAYTAVLAGAGALLYWLAPSLVLGLVYTSEYAGVAAVLQWYGLAILAFSLAVVVLNFELARDRHRYVVVFALVSCAEIALLWVFHESMVGYAQIILGANAVLTVLGLLEVAR